MSSPQPQRIWRDLDQAQLDEAYDQRRHAPNMLEVLRRCAVRSEDVRVQLGAPERHAYGPSAIETLDLYRTAQPHAPVAVFVHGGGWRSGQAADYAFMAPLFVQNGVHLALLDFTTVQDAGGSLMPMADQVRRALAWVYRHAQQWGGNPGRLFVCGHSSGAHLAAVALTTDWHALDLPRDVLKGGLCCSGMYELEPVRLSARSAYITFNDGIEHALSPQRHLAHLHAPLVIAFGTRETPEFQRQAQDVAVAVAAAGKPVELLSSECNHFEILETLADPSGVLGSAMLRLMGLEPRPA